MLLEMGKGVGGDFFCTLVEVILLTSNFGCLQLSAKLYHQGMDVCSFFCHLSCLQRLLFNFSYLDGSMFPCFVFVIRLFIFFFFFFSPQKCFGAADLKRWVYQDNRISRFRLFICCAFISGFCPRFLVICLDAVLKTSNGLLVVVIGKSVVWCSCLHSDYDHFVCGQSLFRFVSLLFCFPCLDKAQHKEGTVMMDWIEILSYFLPLRTEKRLL